MRSKWKVIGLGLRVPPSDLEAMSGSPLECLQSSLTKWLKGIDPLPTWDALVAVLRSRVVGEEKKAQELEEKFCVGTPPPSDIPTSTLSMYTMYFVIIACQKTNISLQRLVVALLPLQHLWSMKKLHVSSTYLFTFLSDSIEYVIPYSF